MPLLDVQEINDSLERDFRSSVAPASRELALFHGDPAIDGVELAGGGYGRQTIVKADWLPAANGEITHTPKTFGDATAPWVEADFWAHYIGGRIADYGTFDPPLIVTAAGPGPVVQTTIYFDDITGG